MPVLCRHGQFFLPKIAELIHQNDDFPIDKAFSLLQNRATFPEESLPKTGVPPEWEKMLSALFIVSPNYGTRVSTIVLEDEAGNWYMEERTYHIENDEIMEINRAVYP